MCRGPGGGRFSGLEAQAQRTAIYTSSEHTSYLHALHVMTYISTFVMLHGSVHRTHALYQQPSRRRRATLVGSLCDIFSVHATMPTKMNKLLDIWTLENEYNIAFQYSFLAVAMVMSSRLREWLLKPARALVRERRFTGCPPPSQVFPTSPRPHALYAEGHG